MEMRQVKQSLTALLLVAALVYGLTASAFAAPSVQELTSGNDVLSALKVLNDEYPDPIDIAQYLNKAIEGVNKILRDNNSALPAFTPVPAGTDPVNYFLTNVEAPAIDELQKLGVQDPRKTLEFAATAYMLASLHDSHTSFIDPDTFQKYQDRQNGGKPYAGVGIILRCFNQHDVYAWDVIPGGPAQKSGMERLDKFIAVDGQNVVGPDCKTALSAASNKLHGSAGTPVSVALMRQGASVNLTIVRDLVKLPAIEYGMFPNNIGYIEMGGFLPGISTVFKRVVAELLRDGAQGFIFDLRGNPGGSLEDCRRILSMILPAGTVILQGHDKTQQISVKTSGLSLIPASMPIAVLADESSASASEVVAAAIQENNRGAIVGTKTAGALEVSNVLELPNGAAMSVTIVRAETGKGVRIEGSGVKPDYSVDLTSTMLDQGKDPQLYKAFEYVLSKLNNP